MSTTTDTPTDIPTNETTLINTPPQATVDALSPPMTTSADISQDWSDKVNSWNGIQLSGRVNRVVGLLIESVGPKAFLGELCYIYGRHNKTIPCEVVGFKEKNVLLMSLGDMEEITVGAEVYSTGRKHVVAVNDSMCGRVLGPLGDPIDEKKAIPIKQYYPVTAPPPNPLTRKRIEEVFGTGIRSFDAMCTVGKGQRLGIFAGSGVGKSTLMAMIAQMSTADINVIGLIGERGREVREFIERDLGKEGLARSVIVVATSDQPALLRAKAAYVATAIAEFYRDQGKSVCLIMDSLTRYAMALREIGLAIGEPPTTKGYTPSVFATLPKLLERSGNNETGSITGIYTILVDGDDMNDPLADTVRSILDGHIVLSRKLATGGQYPPISILDSLSRVMPDVVSPEHVEAANRFREILQTYADAEDLININAYVSGSNPKIDKAIALMPQVRAFLKQKSNEFTPFEEIQKQLFAITKNF